MSSPSSFLQGLALVDEVVRRERSGRLVHNASRLSEATGIERSRVSRLTQELRDVGFLERDDDALFGAGADWFRTASALTRPWLRAARADLRRLAGAQGVTGMIAAADGPAAVLLRVERPNGADGGYLHPGARVPIWCTGAGRALLWENTDADIAVLLRDVQFVGVGGPAAARSVADVLRLQARDRESGIVDAAQEYVEGVQEYALPLRGGSGIVGAVAVSMSPRGSRRTRETREALRRIADRLSAIARDAD
ncbi:IclR family transcriptional regulator [Microbacterium sp. AG790]|uniref:IclR family transcriptional regulator domain-containing protein n=1 Tax=Microbacterium sp. AG790 TaxID=2183995 RepID=UPI000EB2A0AB|nr:IclR family transcriptional regulator C-terminal domain-containing protein [Microbacterium sp. AG790]RKS93351.1 IclR family transcriptional regulator [Microbacterium sp. AG790]